jgi:hypothetical protein
MEQPKRVFQEMTPNDARIYINFMNKKKPVSFQYPSKESTFSLIMWLIGGNWAIIILIILLVNLPLTLILLPIDSTPKNSIDSSEVGTFIALFPSILIFLFLIPLLITLIIISNKSFLKQIPKIMQRMELFFKRGYNQVIVKNLKSKKYTLPIFSNIFLEYKATEDYGKYLKKIEVKEYDFWTIKRHITNRKKDKVKQTEYWKADFIFTEVPKKGELKLTFI